MSVIHIARNMYTGEVIAVGESAKALHFGIAASDTLISDIQLEVLSGEAADTFRVRHAERDA